MEENISTLAAEGVAQVEDCDNMIDLGSEELKVGFHFPSEESAVKSIDNWAYKTLCPLVKVIHLIKTSLALPQISATWTFICLGLNLTWLISVWFLDFFLAFGFFAFVIGLVLILGLQSDNIILVLDFCYGLVLVLYLVLIFFMFQSRSMLILVLFLVLVLSLFWVLVLFFVLVLVSFLVYGVIWNNYITFP